MRPELSEAIRLLEKDADNPVALDRALRLLSDTVYSFAMKLCGHVEDTEDTVQEVLLRTAQYLKRFQDPRALNVWLYKVARTSCLMQRRRGKHEPKQFTPFGELLPGNDGILSLTLPADTLTPEEAFLQKELQGIVQTAILTIPYHYRIVLVLRDMEQLTLEEVATIMDLRLETAKKRLHRARALLRNRLAKSLLQRPTQEKRNHA